VTRDAALTTLRADEAGRDADAVAARLTPPAPEVSDADLARAAAEVERLAALRQGIEDELARARGALEQVGGTTVREQLREVARALADAKVQQQEVEVSYDAWKLLTETLKEAAATQSTHLGNALSGPVGQRFADLTGARYGALELGPALEAGGLHVAGAARDLHVLSAGTQDQLATVLRLVLAEQLHCTLVLDDHLSQSDPAKVAWFNAALRRAANQIQIVMITCRPAEFLAADELPGPGASRKVSAGGLVNAVDLGRVIRRHHAPMLG
jgi:uncharacterized protein YhaN